MDADDVEDLLFGPEDSQEYLGDAISDISDDDMLDFQEDDEATLWDLEDIPVSTPATVYDPVEYEDVQDTARQPSHQEDSSQAVVRTARDRAWVIARIEAMLERIVDGLLEESEALTITLKTRVGLSRRRVNGTHADGKLPEAKQRDISFPGATAQEAWNFTVLLRILELVHGGLVDNTIMTKRDIYYRHPDLFVKQTVVDRYIDDLACTFGISRSQLNVTAAAKGLVAGSFSIIRQDGHHIDGTREREGILVPKIGEHDTLDLRSVRWVLVIEKEATFRSLLSSSQWNTLGSQGLILTAKGYPDVASRTFLRHVTDHAPHVPIYALVDLDPDGIAILSTYKYGSYRLAHEDVTRSDTPGLGLPNIRWLGVKSHHMSRTPVSESDTDTSTMSHLQGLMKLTARDRTKAARMLEWNLCAEDGPEQEWRQELQTMLMLNIKAEMQILDELPGGLVSWVSGELEKGLEQPLELVVSSSCSDDGMLF